MSLGNCLVSLEISPTSLEKLQIYHDDTFAYSFHLCKTYVHSGSTIDGSQMVFNLKTISLLLGFETCD